MGGYVSVRSELFQNFNSRLGVIRTNFILISCKKNLEAYMVLKE